MSASPRALLGFPNPVNEAAARVVASGVVVMSVLVLVAHQWWVLVPLTYGFAARVASGPRLSPLGQLATRVVAPRLPVGARLVAGPPKRFAQGIGLSFAGAASALYFGAGDSLAASVLLGVLGACALLEAGVGLCLGCKAYGVMSRLHLVGESACPECSDLSLRRARAARS